EDPVTPEPDLHLASNGRVRPANRNSIGGVILSNHQIPNPVGCDRSRSGRGLLATHRGNVGGRDNHNSRGNSDGNEKLRFHIQYDTYPGMLLGEIQTGSFRERGRWTSQIS